jgi:beta-mannosidase
LVGRKALPLWESDLVAQRRRNRPEPFKFIEFPAPQEVGLKLAIGADGESVRLSSQKPIKGLVLDVQGEDVCWSDQALDLVPDDAQTIRAVGLRGRKVQVRFLGDGST